MNCVTLNQKKMVVFRGFYVPEAFAKATAIARPRRLTEREKKLKQRVEQICRQAARKRPGEFLSAGELFPRSRQQQKTFTRLLHNKPLFISNPFTDQLQVSSGIRDGKLWEGVRYINAKCRMQNAE